MGKKLYKAVASDLDGTLLLNGAQHLDEDAIAAIHALHEAGILFIAASGRQYSSLKQLFAPVKDEIAYICENGTLCVAGNEIISMADMDRERGLELINEIMDRDDCELLVSGKTKCFIQPKGEWYLNHLRNNLHNDVLVMEDIRHLQEPFMKIALNEPGGLFDSDYWKEKYGDSFEVANGGNNWVDFMPYNVHKGSALKTILDHYGIEPEACIAFGDNENDREMLETAGYPVTMTTAVDSIKPIGKSHVDHVPSALRALIRGEFPQD